MINWAEIIKANQVQIIEFGKKAFQETKATRKEQIVIISGTPRLCCYLFPASEDIQVGKPFENVDGTICLPVLRFIWDENLVADLDIESSITHELTTLISQLEKDCCS